MDDATYTHRIREIVAAVLEVDAGTIGDDTDFVMELGADSLAVIEVMARLETLLDVRIDQSQLARMTSVAAIREIVAGSQMRLAA